MNTTDNKSISILIADDDEEDRMLALEAFQESRLANDLRFVSDGEELMDYLYRRGQFIDPSNSPRPGLILLDLNMPKKNGREVLQEIKANPRLRNIPVVVLTTSKADTDICQSYNLGANSFITKPVTFDGLVEVVKTLGKYWFTVVELPLQE
jgi:CheY-like chemotaxis protein